MGLVDPERSEGQTEPAWNATNHTFPGSKALDYTSPVHKSAKELASSFLFSFAHVVQVGQGLSFFLIFTYKSTTSTGICRLRFLKFLSKNVENSITRTRKLRGSVLHLLNASHHARKVQATTLLVPVGIGLLGSPPGQTHGRVSFKSLCFFGSTSLHTMYNGCQKKLRRANPC